MQRRNLLKTGLATTGAVAVAGCLFGGDGGNGNGNGNGNNPGGTGGDDPPERADDLPAYAEWVPEGWLDDPDGGSVTHFDPVFFRNLATSGQPDNIKWLATPLFAVPIYGAGARTSSVMSDVEAAPFGGAALVGEGDDAHVDGIHTDMLTPVGATVVCHGSYDTSVFEAEYGENQSQTTDGFTVYTDSDADDSLAYAVSEDVVVVAAPQPGVEYDDPETELLNTLEQGTDGTTGVSGHDGSEWVYTAAGHAPIVYGGMNASALNIDDETNITGETEGEIHPDELSVFADADQLLTSMSSTFGDGQIQGLEADFAAVYPEGKVPSKETLETELFTVAGLTIDVPYKIQIDGARVHVSAAENYE